MELDCSRKADVKGPLLCVLGDAVMCPFLDRDSAALDIARDLLSLYY